MVNLYESNYSFDHYDKAQAMIRVELDKHETFLKSLEVDSISNLNTKIEERIDAPGSSHSAVNAIEYVTALELVGYFYEANLMQLTIEKLNPDSCHEWRGIHKAFLEIIQALESRLGYAEL